MKLLLVLCTSMSLSVFADIIVISPNSVVSKVEKKTVDLGSYCAKYKDNECILWAKREAEIEVLTITAPEENDETVND